MGLSDGAALASVALIFVWVIWTLVHGPKEAGDDAEDN
jgi:hypothetical protein